MALRGQIAAPAGFTLALVGFYSALHTSFAGEILQVFLHVPFPVVGIFAVIVPLVVLSTGSVLRFLGIPLALPWMLFNAWVIICSAVSFYPRGSITSVIPFELRLQIIPFLFCAVATTSKGVRRLLSITAIGVLPIIFLCFTEGQTQAGTRFNIPGTSLENPNDLAFHLLWGAALLLLFLLHKGKLGKLLTLVVIPASLWFILKTASRSNFLTIFAVVVVGLLLAAPSVRAILLVVVPIGLAIALPLLPKATLSRIFAVEVTSSIADVGADAAETADMQDRRALGSEEERMQLAALAVDATVRHPVFGVGMLMFAGETADFMKKTSGRKAPWLTAHNSYLKISSENGVPGLFFYVWSILTAFWMTWRTFQRSRGRPGFEDASRNSVCILLALVVYAFGTFFCDIVYLPYCAITLGLAAANYLAFRNDDRLATALARP